MILTSDTFVRPHTNALVSSSNWVMGLLRASLAVLHLPLLGHLSCFYYPDNLAFRSESPQFLIERRQSSAATL